MKKILCIFFFLAAVCAYSQEISPYGNFPVTSYRSSDFKAPGQIGSTAQNDLGEMFFSTNTGILMFNGETWRNIKVREDGKKISALASDQDGVVYFGGKTSIGYLKRAKVKSKKYEPQILLSSDSLTFDKNGDSVIFKEILFLASYGDFTYFIGSKNYYKYQISTKQLESFNFPDDILVETAYSTYNKVLIYSQMSENDSVSCKIVALDEFGIKNTPNSRKVHKDSFDKRSELKGVYQIKNTYFFIQGDGQVFTSNNLYEEELQPVKDGFKKEGIYQGVVANINFHDNVFYFGTDESGVICYSTTGEHVRTLNSSNGLTDVNVENSFIDRDGNLWLNYDKGLEIIELDAPVRFYNYKTKFYEYVERVYHKDTSLLIATTQHIYKINDKGEFHRFNIKHSKSEAFDLIENQEDFLAIAYDGILKLNNDLTDSLVNNLYAWVFEQSTSDKNVIYVGLDNDGVAVMTRNGSQWTDKSLHKDVTGTVRSLCSYQNKLYFSQVGLGMGVYDEHDQSYQLLKPSFKIEEGDGYVIEEFDDKLWIGSRRGLLEMQGDALNLANTIDGFSDSTTYIHRLHNDGHGRLWAVLFRNYKKDNEAREIGFLHKKDGEYVFESTAFKDLKSVTVQSLSRNGNHMWFSGSEGLFYHNIAGTKAYRKEFEVLVDEFLLNGDTLTTNYDSLRASSFELEYAHSSVHIYISAPQYFGEVKNEYRFQLVGFDNKWSTWSSRNEREYRKLSHGEYILKFQARNYYGTESDVKEIRFTVLPPWYFTWWAYLMYFVLAILIIVLVARLSVKRVKKQKDHLEEVVKERTSEIAEQNQQLEHQKTEIEEKSNDILDSIKYAERIQQTILPADSFMEEMFEEHFVLFRPKDIVSGDFYWAEVSKKMFLFSAIDCTGHGVPGAFVSIVGHNGLTRAIKEFEHSKPHNILDTLREIVVEAFKGQGKSDVKDGMDIALCGIDYENMILHFSGANNPCVIIRNGEIHEIKADKQPIGQFEYAKPFTPNEFKLEKGDCIYVYTDGYIDQFGGEKGKKFKSRPFKKMLLEIHQMPMKEQLPYLDAKFDDWRGENEQIDDVCVFGVRI